MASPLDGQGHPQRMLQPVEVLDVVARNVLCDATECRSRFRFRETPELEHALEPCPPSRRLPIPVPGRRRRARHLSVPLLPLLCPRQLLQVGLETEAAKCLPELAHLVANPFLAGVIGEQAPCPRNERPSLGLRPGDRGLQKGGVNRSSSGPTSGLLEPLQIVERRRLLPRV